MSWTRIDTGVAKEDQKDIRDVLTALQADGCVKSYKTRGGSLTVITSGPYGAYVSRKQLVPWISKRRHKTEKLRMFALIPPPTTQIEFEP